MFIVFFVDFIVLQFLSCVVCQLMLFVAYLILLRKWYNDDE